MKCLSVVLCLDISYSMNNTNTDGESRMKQMNDAVQAFMEAIIKYPRARAATEIAFVLFDNCVRCETDFVNISKINASHFSCAVDMKPVSIQGKEQKEVTFNVPQFPQESVTSTMMANAVILSINKLVRRREQMKNQYSTDTYTPFFVLVTDADAQGLIDPKYLQEEAIRLVNQHCDREYDPIGIAPFIIGVGNDIDEKTLKQYAASFPRGYFRVPDSNQVIPFRKVFETIGNSLTNSMSNKTVSVNTGNNPPPDRIYLEPVDGTDDPNKVSKNAPDTIQSMNDYLAQFDYVRYND